VTTEQAPRYVAIPPGRRARLFVPARPTRLAAASLRIYHPVTRKGRVASRVARAAAGLGAFRLLPARTLPADLDAIDGIPTATAWGIQVSRHGTRIMALALDPAGKALCIVKLARSHTVAELLAKEARSIDVFGPLLDPPVVASHVRSARPGVLCFDAADWTARSPAWVLPPEVARSLGTLYRRGGGDARRGPAHGDFAPWNLMKLRAGGWVLIDWEEATRDGRPFQDPFHWLVQAHAELGRPRISEIRAGLNGSGWVGAALREYAAAAGLEDVDQAGAFLAHLEATIANLSASDDEAPAAIAARQRMYAALRTSPAPTDSPVR
jgi:hypothetical protein